MSTPYLGEIRLFAFGRIPTGWHSCDGSLLPISQNDALYALLGTTYGGDGISTFAVPDLRGRVPLHQGQGQGLTNRPIGSISGTESVTLLSAQLPEHNHPFHATTVAGSTRSPATAMPAAVTGDTFYAVNFDGATMLPMANGAISSTQGNQPHENMMPILVANFCIATMGVFPSQQ